MIAIDKLTRTEAEVLAQIARGLSNREIAQERWVTEQTVKFHVSNLLHKLGVRNRTEAAAFAQHLPSHLRPPTCPTCGQGIEAKAA